MQTNPPQPAPQSHTNPQPGYYPVYPPPKPGMSGGKIALIVCGIIFGVLFLFGLLVGVLAVATIPKLTEAKEKLEVKQMDDLYMGLRSASVDNEKKRQLQGTLLKDAKGGVFWEVAFDEAVLDSAQATRVVSPMGTDRAGNARPVPASSVSYTAPKGGELITVLSRTGSERCVVFTWNSRNWRNAKGERVPVAWSGSGMVQWLTFAQANADWGITQSEWDDPSGKLFGKKAPFQYTYE